MDFNERIIKLKEHLYLSKINYEEIIMKSSTLKEAHVYCIIYNLSAQQYGSLLEKYIIVKFKYSKNKANNCIGDCNKNGNNLEIKVSLGGVNHDKFNYVQIRPSHDCNTYLLTAYYLSYDNIETEGELFIFKISKNEIKNLILKYGSYAHGTVKKNGIITIENLNDKNNINEYALRPKINDNCWKELMKFYINENEI